MQLRTFVYLTSQYHRHGVKSSSDRTAGSAAVNKMLNRIYKKDSSDNSDNEKRKKKERSPYGQHKKGTNTFYFVDGAEFSLGSGGEAPTEQELSAWDNFIIKATNIATRLEATPQYDISGKKAAYQERKNTLFKSIMGDAAEVSLTAADKRRLDDALSEKSFSYWKSWLMIVVLSDTIIPELSHCKQDQMSEDGMYVYHIRSKTVITATLLSQEILAGLDVQAVEQIKLLPSKEATRFKTLLRAVYDNRGNVIRYYRKLESL